MVRGDHIFRGTIYFITGLRRPGPFAAALMGKVVQSYTCRVDPLDKGVMQPACWFKHGPQWPVELWKNVVGEEPNKVCDDN